MVQIGRRALSNYFKMIIRNRFYANNTCFLKNEVSRTPMWTRDFLAPDHNIQIINWRLQRSESMILLRSYHNIQIINRRLQHIPSCQPWQIDHNIQIINRRLRSASFSIRFAIILTHNSLVRMNIKDTLSYSELFEESHRICCEIVHLVVVMCRFLVSRFLI